MHALLSCLSALLSYCTRYSHAFDALIALFLQVWKTSSSMRHAHQYGGLSMSHAHQYGGPHFQ